MCLSPSPVYSQLLLSCHFPFCISFVTVVRFLNFCLLKTRLYSSVSLFLVLLINVLCLENFFFNSYYPNVNVTSFSKTTFTTTVSLIQFHTSQEISSLPFSHFLRVCKFRFSFLPYFFVLYYNCVLFLMNKVVCAPCFLVLKSVISITVFCSKTKQTMLK